MLPVIHLFGYSIQSYYLCAALAGAVVFLLALIALRRLKLGIWSFLLPLAVLVLALFGARMLNVLTNPEAYESFSPWSLRYTKLSLMGGLGLGVLALILWCALKRRKPGQILDAFSIPAAAGIVLLKTGCFLNGCCFGKPTQGPFGMVFPANEIKYEFIERLPLIRASSRVVHPTQIYEIFGALCALALAVFLEKRLRLLPGSRAALFCAGFSLARLIILPLRALPYEDWVIRYFYPALYLFVIALCLIALCFVFNRKPRGNAS